jgi:GNAT superfamily N-acetyltransferase
MAQPQLRIVRATGAPLAEPVRRQIEAIFFEASGRTFAPGPERDAFRERWLGRYLDSGSDEVFLALAGDDTLAGYAVGDLEDPSGQARFDDIAYFRAEFASLCRQYPAHLHINLAPAFRGRGIGARLIEAFAERARAAGVPGLHVVTGEGMRNVRFYQRCGFAERGRATWNGRPIVFLGRELGQGT